MLGGRGIVGFPKGEREKTQDLIPLVSDPPFENKGYFKIPYTSLANDNCAQKHGPNGCWES